MLYSIYLNYSPLSQFEVNIFPFINSLNFNYYGSNLLSSLSYIPISHIDESEYEFNWMSNEFSTNGYYDNFFNQTWVKYYKFTVRVLDDIFINDFISEGVHYIYKGNQYNELIWEIQKKCWVLYIIDEDLKINEILDRKRSLLTWLSKDFFTFQFWINKYNFYIKSISDKAIIILIYYFFSRIALLGSIRNRFRTHLTIIRHFKNVKRPTYYHLVHNTLDNYKTEKAAHKFTLWGKGMYKTPKTNMLYIITLGILSLMFLPFYNVTDSFFSFYDKTWESLNAGINFNKDTNEILEQTDSVLFRDLFYHIFKKTDSEVSMILFFKDDESFPGREYLPIYKDDPTYDADASMFKNLYNYLYKNLGPYIQIIIPIKDFDYTIWLTTHMWEVYSILSIVQLLGADDFFDYENYSLHLIYESFNIYSLDILFSFITLYILLFIFNKDSFSYNSNKLIPNKYQLISEYLYKISLNLFVSNIGKNIKEKAFFIKVTTILIFILISNVQGMIPYMSTLTSSLSNTFFIALALFTSIIITILKKKGWKYLLCLFMPQGCPIPLLLLLIPIEIISYTFRVVSLSVRLFANMMAGHTLLKVIVGFSWEIVLVGQLFLLINFIPVITLFILTLLEIGVAFIQTYIFTILTCIYLKDIFFGH